VNSEKQQGKNRELTDVELDAVNGAWADYVYNPAKATGMSIENQNAIARSQELSAIYIADHPIHLPH
jgi:hypothetical protein